MSKRNLTSLTIRTALGLGLGLGACAPGDDTLEGPDQDFAPSDDPTASDAWFTLALGTLAV